MYGFQFIGQEVECGGATCATTTDHRDEAYLSSSNVTCKIDHRPHGIYDARSDYRIYRQPHFCIYYFVDIFNYLRKGGAPQYLVVFGRRPVNAELELTTTRVCGSHDLVGNVKSIGYDYWLETCFPDCLDYLSQIAPRGGLSP
ncbi:hypothetical protein Save01_03862 [Streptomyces avermitilis]